MGTNSKTGHASYTLAPSAGPGVDLGAETATFDGDAEFAIDLVAVIVGGGTDPEDPLGQPAVDLPTDVVERFEVFTKAVEDAIVAGAGLNGEAGERYHQRLADLCAEYLSTLRPDELEEIAAAQGFQHPMLVGMSGGQPHPLAGWLDPTVSADSKAKIQAVAQNRFAALCAGEIIGGKDLAGWVQDHPQLASAQPPTLPPGIAMWNPTSAQLAQLKTDFTAVANGFGDGAHSTGSVADLIALENRIASAYNPVLAHEITVLAESARHQVDALLGHVTGSELAHAVANSHLQSDVNQVLDPQQTLKLLRLSTPADTRAELENIASERTSALAAATAAAGEIQLSMAAGPLSDQDAATLLGHLHTVTIVGAQAHSWNASTPPAPMPPGVVDDGRNAVLAWMSKQKLPALKQLATTAGLLPDDVAATAATASIKQTIGAHIGVSGSAQPRKSVLAEPVMLNPKSRFGKQHAQLVASLRQTQAAHAAVPPAADPAAVAAWDFGPGQPAALGGTYPKSLHPGPDGTTWLAKGETKSTGGALIQAEAAASRLLARVGQPAVPVYATTIGGKPASVQPMVAGAMPMTGSVSSWSQADVDAVVRMHVTCWALGNHDAHAGNVLRTADGGLVPIDYGQAFKNYGKDKLSLHYRPSTTNVYDRAYDAHLAGKLPSNVKINPAVAHSVIKQLEAVPDTEWRAMLHTTAHAGAKQKLSWEPMMRARAAKQHGVPESDVTTGQIADTFLDFAVDRKKNLRRDFATFFAEDLKMPVGKSLRQLGEP